MMDVNGVLDILDTISSFDIEGAYDAVLDGDTAGEFKSLEDVASIVATFFPQVEIVIAGIELLKLIDAAQKAGLISAATVESPAMQRAEGHTGLGQSRT